MGRKIQLVNRAGPVQGRMTLRRPFILDGFDLERVHSEGWAEITVSKKFLGDLLFEILLFAVDLRVFLWIPLLKQNVERVMLDPGTILPADPCRPRIIDPSFG